MGNILLGFHNRPAHQLRPPAVDRHPCGQGVGRIHQPPGQAQTVFRPCRVPGIERRGGHRLNFHPGVEVIAAFHDARGPGLGHLHHHQRRGRLNLFDLALEVLQLLPDRASGRSGLSVRLVQQLLFLLVWSGLLKRRHHRRRQQRRVRIGFDHLDSNVADRAAATEVLIERESQFNGSALLGHDRLGQFEHRPVGLAELRCDGPTGLGLAVDGAGHGPALLRKIGRGGQQLHGAALMRDRKFVEHEVRPLSVPPTRPLSGNRRMRQGLQAHRSHTLRLHLRLQGVGGGSGQISCKEDRTVFQNGVILTPGGLDRNHLGGFPLQTGANRIFQIFFPLFPRDYFPNAVFFFQGVVAGLQGTSLLRHRRFERQGHLRPVEVKRHPLLLLHLDRRVVKECEELVVLLL